jgi:hypothetical protein
MPKIYEELIVVKVCKMIRNDELPAVVVNQEIENAIASVVEELAGPGVIVEVERA